jgi:hypothetical protein
MMKIKMQFELETPGAYRYKELDADGKMLPVKDAKIGTLYIRKPYNKSEFITVTIEEVE